MEKFFTVRKMDWSGVVVKLNDYRFRKSISKSTARASPCNITCSFTRSWSLNVSRRCHKVLSASIVSWSVIVLVFRDAFGVMEKDLAVFMKMNGNLQNADNLERFPSNSTHQLVFSGIFQVLDARPCTRVWRAAEIFHRPTRFVWIEFCAGPGLMEIMS